MEEKQSKPAITIGDVVALKSGSPWMTVTKVVGDYIHCLYFDQGGQGHVCEFCSPLQCLKKEK